MEYKCSCCGKEIKEGGLIAQHGLESWAVCSSCIGKTFRNIMNKMKEAQEDQEKELADFMTEMERLREENKDKYDYE